MNNARLLVDEELVRSLHIGEVAFGYYNLQRVGPTNEDYHEWLALMPELLSMRYRDMGFEEAINSLDFRRYFLELRDREMKKYMQENLSPEDYSFWLETRHKPENL